MVECICENCGNKYNARNGNLQRNKHNFCSLKCMYEFRRKNDLRETFVNDDYFNTLTPKVCWLLGLIASDGCVEKNKFLCLSQSGDEGLKCIQYIKTELNYNGNVYTYKPKKGKKVYSLRINSKILVNKLKEYNIVKNKTKIFSIPDIILNDENYLRYFLWGYIDGDGCVGIYDRNFLVEFVCNEFMCNQLLNNKFLPKSTSKILNKISVKEFRYNNYNGLEFCKWLFNKPKDIYQSYKYRKYCYYIDNILDKTRKVKYNNIREKIYELLGNNIKCMDISKKLNINFQFVYKCRKELLCKKNMKS